MFLIFSAFYIHVANLILRVHVFGSAQERDEEDLALLSSISKCMEDHKLSPSEFTSFAAKIALLEERVGKPKQACTGVKRKRTEECVE